MFLPVVLRELSVRSRHASTFYVRAVAAGLVALIGGAALFVMSLPRMGGGRPMGAELLGALTLLLLLYVLVEGVRQAAGGISQERREGTLGFLFLTDLSSLDVLLGKLSGAALTTLYALLATLPFAGLTLLFGGVTGGEFFRHILALLAALAVALGCGAWASVRCRDGMAAVAVATALLLADTILPLALDAGWQLRSGAFVVTNSSLGLFSPLTSLQLASDLNQRFGTARFWLSLAAQGALAILLVADAARRLRALWRRDECAPRVARNARRSDRVRRDFGEVIARTLAARVRLGRWLAGLVALKCLAHGGVLMQWLVPQSSGLNFMLISLPLGLAGLAGTLLFVHLATRVFADARHTGEMEILLTTRLEDGELVRLLWQTLRRVVLCLAGLDLLFNGLRTWYLFTHFPPGSPPEMRWSLLPSAFGESISVVFNWVALTWSAMWFGISSRRNGAAVAR
ncbi:MAG TPA: hypothetical protein VMB21_21995, partial [Candidatus Limnocylindria bacterium]|nr:hypothetical protein [Candidatus Limnocylindria bacterium]